MKWFDEYRVHYYYTDYNQILKPSYIGRYMQETAWSALKGWGPTPEYLYENKLAFILSKISFRYYEEIREDDAIKVETWPNLPSGLTFPRNYRIYKNGKIAVEAVSAWAVLDVREKSVLRPGERKDVLTAYDDEKLGFDVLRRIKMPENMGRFGEYRVKCSDIDGNLHMNNAVYIDLVCDSLYEEGDEISPALKKRVLSIDINYHGEARFAQTLEIDKGAALCADGKAEECYLKAKIKGEERICFEAKVTSIAKRGRTECCQG
jgi:acyl-CoA thioesterase FadM